MLVVLFAALKEYQGYESTNHFTIRKESTMRKVLTAFAALVIVSMAAASESNAMAQVEHEGGGGGSWADVCCGSTCGEDFCVGSGTYTCCKV